VEKPQRPFEAVNGGNTIPPYQFIFHLTNFTLPDTFPTELKEETLMNSHVHGQPNFWLWQTPWWFGIFWGLNGIALAQILLVVCRACKNQYCPMQQAQG